MRKDEMRDQLDSLLSCVTDSPDMAKKLRAEILESIQINEQKLRATYNMGYHNSCDAIRHVIKNKKDWLK